MTNGKFQIVSKYAPSGDQPKAIDELVHNINNGVKAVSYTHLMDGDLDGFIDAYLRHSI